jgi:hypothetical protein
MEMRDDKQQQQTLCFRNKNAIDTFAEKVLQKQWMTNSDERLKQERTFYKDENKKLLEQMILQKAAQKAQNKKDRQKKKHLIDNLNALIDYLNA